LRRLLTLCETGKRPIGEMVFSRCLMPDSLFLDQIEEKFQPEDADLLRRAYAHCVKKTGRCEPDGFPAARLLLHQNADAVTVAAALLAPLLWGGLVTSVQLREEFGPDVADVLQDLKSPSLLRLETPQYRREDIHTFLAAMGGSPRKALLLIAFRLLALEGALDSPEQQPRGMARETVDFYVPIANRLGLGDLRRRLEDSSFRILDPEGYEDLRKKVAPIQAEDDKCLQILLEGVRRLLRKNHIQGRVQGRTKSLHAIRRKMLRTGRTLEQIMDRIGLRVIVASVPECYTVLGLLHTHFKPIPGTFDDYIGLPKDNGYQSLHTCVYPVREISAKPIEFQVRTELMHMEAEYGTAAHWRYKSGLASDAQDRYRSQWIQGLVRQHEKADSAGEFIDLLNRQVFRDHLVVFGSGGRIVRLSDSATVQDFLNTTNTQVPVAGAVRVNGKPVSLDHRLRDGDSVEIAGGEGSVPSHEPTSAKHVCTSEV